MLRNKQQRIDLFTSLVTITKRLESCNTVANEFAERKIYISKLVSVTTDGSASVTQKDNGSVNLFKKHVSYSSLGFYCTIYLSFYVQMLVSSYWMMLLAL